MRHLPKVVWLLLILIAPIAGPIVWFIAGRPRSEPQARQAARPSLPRRPSAPDDDPMFLAGLDRTNQERRRLEEWERELQAREQELERPDPDEEPGPRDAHEQDGPGDAPAARS